MIEDQAEDASNTKKKDTNKIQQAENMQTKKEIENKKDAMSMKYITTK